MNPETDKVALTDLEAALGQRDALQAALDELEARDMTDEQRRKFWAWRRRFPQDSTP